MTPIRPITPLVGAAAVALGIAACGGGDDNQSATTERPTTSAGRPATLGVSDSGLGKILVDSRGRTLYLFQKDAGTRSACFGACAAQWPPLRASGKPSVGSGATASKVATTKRSDGNPEVTYNGHPLYRFSGDQAPGDTNGQGLNAFGAVWQTLSPAGNGINAPSSSGPSGGY